MAKSPKTPQRVYHDSDGAPHRPPKCAKARFRPSAYALIVRQDGRLLLVSGVDSPQWGPPGGGCRPGELMVEGAMRETYEETGGRIIIAPGTQPYFVHERFFFRPKMGCLHGLMFIYLLELDEVDFDQKVVKRIKDGKHDETARCTWVDPRSLRRRDVGSAFHEVFQAYFERKSKLRPRQGLGWAA